ALGHVPADRLHDDVALADAKLEMILLLTDDPGLADDLELSGHEQRFRIADSRGLEPVELLDDAYAEGRKGDLRIEKQDALKVLGREGDAAALLEKLGEGVDLIARHFQARSRGMTPEGGERLRAILDRRIEVEPGDRPGGSLRDRLSLRQHD